MYDEATVKRVYDSLDELILFSSFVGTHFFDSAEKVSQKRPLPFYTFSIALNSSWTILYLEILYLEIKSTNTAIVIYG